MARIKLKLGIKVLITKTELYYAQNQEGILVGFKDNGYIVNIHDVTITKSGAVPVSQKETVTVWCEEVKEVK